MQWKVTCWGLCSETAWLCNWLSHFFDLSFSLVTRTKHLKLLQAVMLSDPLQRASGSYNHQRFNSQTSWVSRKFDQYLQLFIYCPVGLLWSPSLVPEPPRDQLHAGRKYWEWPSVLWTCVLFWQALRLYCLFFWIILHHSAFSYTALAYLIINNYVSPCILIMICYIPTVPYWWLLM